MRYLKSTCVIVLVSIVALVAPTTRAAQSTYIGNVETEVNPSSCRAWDSASITTRFQILGDARSIFDEEHWALAYLAGKTEYTLAFAVSVREDVRFWRDREIAQPEQYTRKATIVAGDGRKPGPFWVEIEFEDGTTIVPRTEREAQSLMFDFQETYRIRAASLGSGDNDIFSQIEAEWSGYLFSGSDEVHSRSDSPRAFVRVG